MASITIKDIPHDVHVRLVAKAKQNGRSLNSEVIQCLRQAAYDTPRDIEKQLADLEEHHRRQRELGFWTTAEEVQAYKVEGRK